MQPIVLKRGSQLTIPLPAGITVTSATPGAVTVTMANGTVVLLAGPTTGSSWLTLSFGSDPNNLKIQFLVNVA